MDAAPFQLVLSVGAGAENGWAHTVGNTIVIPESRRGSSTASVASLLVHEATHVHQRRFPDDARKAAERMGYDVVAPMASGLLGEPRANPDTDGKVYIKKGFYCESVWPEGPEKNYGLAGVRIMCSLEGGPAGDAPPEIVSGWNNGEHPSEVAAEQNATIFSSSRSPREKDWTTHEKENGRK